MDQEDLPKPTEEIVRPEQRRQYVESLWLGLRDQLAMEPLDAQGWQKAWNNFLRINDYEGNAFEVDQYYQQLKGQQYDNTNASLGRFKLGLISGPMLFGSPNRFYDGLTPEQTETVQGNIKRMMTPLAQISQPNLR